MLVSLGVKASCCLPQNAFWGLHHYQLLYLHTFFCNCRCVFLINLIFYILISNNWKHGCRVSVYFINTLCKSNIAYLFRKYNVMFQFNYGLKHSSLTLTYFVFAWLPFLAYLHVLIWWNSNCSCVITTLLRSVQKDCLCFLTTLGWCIVVYNASLLFSEKACFKHNRCSIGCQGKTIFQMTLSTIWPLQLQISVWQMNISWHG